MAEILGKFEKKSGITIPTEHASKVTSIESFLVAAMQVSVATSINGLGSDGIGSEYGTGPSDFGELDTFSSLGLSELDIYNASKAATDPFIPDFVVDPKYKVEMATIVLLQLLWSPNETADLSIDMLFYMMLATLDEGGGGDQGPDADGDGLSDADELAGGFSTSQPNGITNFLDPDSDGDGFWDGDEVNDKYRSA